MQIILRSKWKINFNKRDKSGQPSLYSVGSVTPAFISKVSL